MQTQTSNSDLRGLIGAYIRTVSDYFVDDGDAAFPRGVNRHATHKNRCGSSTFGNVVLFHIADAVLAYYAFEKNNYTQTHFSAVQFLHEISVIGLGSHLVKGSPQKGYTLFAVANQERLLEA